ncbi:hypothetical protein BJ508DRAFT_327704 [Ascobolus immersus RN42]|uniref:Uncharacterized protein n=1 Tax=Ascobolus immersus RN42 TaxID=1160509 RepID=A0A3N4I3S3_ASCIM|nr:hypothetical protein BJ508DRAFT_327704 [Ascobolus immersus RN42]
MRSPPDETLVNPHLRPPPALRPSPTESSLYITTNASSFLSNSQSSLVARLHANGNEYTRTDSIVGIRRESSPANLGTTTSDDDSDDDSLRSASPICFASTPNLQRLISIRSNTDTAPRLRSFPAESSTIRASDLYELAQGTALDDITEVDSEAGTAFGSRASEGRQSTSLSVGKKGSDGTIRASWKPINLPRIDTSMNGGTSSDINSTTSSVKEMRIKPSAERLGIAPPSNDSAPHSIFQNISRLVKPSKTSLGDSVITSESPQSATKDDSAVPRMDSDDGTDTVTTSGQRTSLREKLSRFFARAETLFEPGSADGRSTTKSHSKYDGVEDIGHHNRAESTPGAGTTKREITTEEETGKLGGQVVE